MNKLQTKEKSKLKDYHFFIIIMILFIIGMIVMTIYKVENLWVWFTYIFIWTWVEMKVAKNIHLSWKVWVLILIGLSVLDLLIINLLN